mgnify:CR=1 FL=1
MWIVETLDNRVDAELDALPEDQRSKFTWIGELIQSRGLEKVHEPYVKHVQGPLWEIRLKGRDGISRAIYVVAKPRKVIVVRIFAKKTRKTPRKEIRLALKRAKELK